MSYRSVAKRRIAGFTLIEMLVTLALLGILGSMAGVVMLRARAEARAMRCISNQQQISRGLLAFYEDRSEFPKDGPDANLADALNDYIPWSENRRDVALPAVWRCPNDRSGPMSNSYQPYYVQRVGVSSSRYFVLGCPRHDDTPKGCVNMRGADALHMGAPGIVRINEQSVSMEGAVEERTARTGTITFEDASTATLAPGDPDYGVSAVASFRNENGTLYSIVRVSGKGETDFSVTKGSQFEVITPVAIIGVRGTQFHVETEPGYTKVTVETGHVVVQDRQTGKTYDLHADEYCEVGVPEGPKKLRLRHHNGKVWEVTNPNDFRVVFCWGVVGGHTNGSDRVYAGAHKMINVRDNYAQTVRLVYYLPGYGRVTTVASRSDDDDDDADDGNE